MFLKIFLACKYIKIIFFILKFAQYSIQKHPKKTYFKVKKKNFLKRHSHAVKTNAPKSRKSAEYSIFHSENTFKYLWWETSFVHWSLSPVAETLTTSSMILLSYQKMGAEQDHCQQKWVSIINRANITNSCKLLILKQKFGVIRTQKAHLDHGTRHKTR